VVRNTAANRAVARTGTPLAESPPAGESAARNPGIEQLIAVGTRVGLTDLELIPRLAEIDIASTVFKIVQITERVCRKILGSKGARQLEVMIGEIEQRNLLGKKAVTYLRHIQNLGAQAVHDSESPTEEAFTLLDVNNAAATLASVLEAAISAKRLEQR
jgi:hypothetical protein